MTSEVLLEFQNVSKVYRTQFVQTYALREVSLRIAEGEFVAIAGPSGSGKSTLLNVLGLLEDFTSGSYRLAGREVRSLNDRQKTHLRRDAIGFVFQGFNLIPQLTVHQNVELPLRYRGLPRTARRQRVNDVLARFGLRSRTDHYPSQLSGGQQQRVAIARALVCEPELVLADEPTGNLDREMGAEIMQLLQAIHADGGTIVMVTHNAEFATLADRSIHLIDGQIALQDAA